MNVKLIVGRTKQRPVPPPIDGPCDVCGGPANTEVVWYFRPSDMTGARSVHRFCDEHGRELHNVVAEGAHHLMGFKRCERGGGVG